MSWDSDVQISSINTAPVFRKELSPPEVPSRIQHVLLTVWVFQENSKERVETLSIVLRAIDAETGRFGVMVLSDLYDKFAVDSFSKKDLSLAILRDFKTASGPRSKDTIHSLVRLTTQIRPHASHEFDMEDAICRRTLFASIAAWRTLGCTLGPSELSLGDYAVEDMLTCQTQYLM